MHSATLPVTHDGSPADLDARTHGLPLTWAEPSPSPSFDPEAVFDAGLTLHHLANTAYPIAHRRTIWRHRRPAPDHARLLARSLSAQPSLSLYLHVPFCRRRCSFCEYCVLERHSDEAEAAYFRALSTELDLYLRLLGPGRVLEGIDVGGGTPSLVQPRRVGALLERIAGHFRQGPGFGVSIETTPRIAADHPRRLKELNRLGIDRISMGLQVVSPALLRRYRRDTNRVDHNRRAVDHMREAGFSTVNVDLMYGLALQTVDDVRRAVDHAVSLDPDVVTLYRMRYEGTRVRGEASRVGLAQVMAMYSAARQQRAGAGYLANPGKKCFSREIGDPGTSQYLTARVIRSVPYLGLGLGAQTFTNNLLAYNHGAATKKLDAYLAATSRGRLPIQDLYHLPRTEGMGKMVSVSFYFGQVHLGAFQRTFGVRFERQFSDEVAFVISQGLMERRGPCLRLTPAGALAFNGVIALFYSNAVKAHLLQRATAKTADTLPPEEEP